MTGPGSRLRAHRRDAVAGVATAVGGLLLFTAARGIESLPGDTETISPATFPTMLSVILMAAGLTLSVSGLRGAERADSDDVPVPPRRLLLMVVSFAAYCVVFVPVGFLLSTTAYLALVSCLIDAARWKRNVLFAAGFSVLVYVLFTEVLAVELPAGVLGWA
jgi:putative tricarboxylic transport membrane protein